MPKTVTLALVDEQGKPLGVLPPFEVDFPYWPETTHIVDTARSAFGVDVTVLRILTVEPNIHFGGAVTYLAEAANIPAAYAGPVDVDLSSQPLRAPYAEPGGPAASLRWAADRLDELGLGPLTSAIQHRTWNLSSIWRLGTPSGPVWLKQVPRFFWHEAPVLRFLAGTGQPSAPTPLAAEDGKILIEHIPGEDLYQADLAVRALIAADFHRLQAVSVDHVAHLLGEGVPDRRTDGLIEVISDVVNRYGGTDARLRDLCSGLPARMAEVAACGLPDALVHGDLHPGNVRGAGNVGGDGDRRVIIDWGDSFIGNPAFDILRLTEMQDETATEHLVSAWTLRWQSLRPDSDPRRAIELLRPVAALRNASVYSTFLDNIEPAEHPYHASDVPDWLGRAAAIV